MTVPSVYIERRGDLRSIRRGTKAGRPLLPLIKLSFVLSKGRNCLLFGAGDRSPPRSKIYHRKKVAGPDLMDDLIDREGETNGIPSLEVESVSRSGIRANIGEHSVHTSRAGIHTDRAVELAEIGDTGRNNVDAFMHEQRMPSRGPRGYIYIYIYLSVDRRRYTRPSTYALSPTVMALPF